MNGDIFKGIKNKLKFEFYLMNDEWLRDCIKFYVNQHPNPADEDILEFVKVQWQLSDLRETNNENGSLPHDLSRQKFIILSENYILQVEQMYDIATSKYKQLEQIRNTRISEVEPSETENLEKWEPPKKRMIQLRLTDGLQNVIAIEYNYMSRLNDMLLPGYKVLIIGPVKCRKGVLLLEEGKLKGIGGEVDSLLIPNALENILARALNLQENPDPYNDDRSKSNNPKGEREAKVEDSLFVDDFVIDLVQVSKIESSHGTDDSRPTIVNAIRTEIKAGTDNATTTILEDQHCEENAIFDDDDCFLEMVDEGQLIESQVQQENITAPFRALPTEDGDDIIVLSEEEPIEDVKFRSKALKKEEEHNSYSNFAWPPDKAVPSTSTAQSKIFKKPKERPAPLIGGKRTVPMSPPETIALKKGRIDRKITEFTKRSTSPDMPKICEFIYDINNEAITEITHRKIRGRVERLKKLGKKDSCWILEATIEDGTGKMEVSFSNEVLGNLLGFSVKEFSLKKKVKNNPEIEHGLRMSLRNAEQRIKTLDDLLELELNVNKKPKVMRITHLTQEQKQAIDKRLTHFLKIKK
ncbi:uncharacterized protein LOC143367598 [Andrena cerasifolii]|uniref:uncharacterized protein LOC143367598 n=1 Tax=Andrena cerasifolii TaxID=2819439 RepID=UPI004037E6A7